VTSTGILRLKKLSGRGIVRAAARHCKRAIAAELGSDSHIDTSRTPDNYVLAGPADADAVAELAVARMTASGISKTRRDAVLAVEFIFSLPRRLEVDARAYFSLCVAWVASRFGGSENILAADVHLDEAAPHCHVLLLPLMGGRMVGSDLVGGPGSLKAHHASFHETVASPFGLHQAPSKLRGARKAGAIASVMRTLAELGDPALRSVAWPQIRDAIDADPERWLVALGLPPPAAPAKRMKSMEQIFIGTGKGPRTEPGDNAL